MVCRMVNGVSVIDEIIDRDLRQCRIDMPDPIYAGVVTRHVADVGRHGHCAVGQCAHIGGRHAQLPGAIVLHRGLIMLAVQGDGDGLPRLCIRAAAQDQILLGFGGVNDVICGEIIHGNGRCLSIDHHHTRGIRAVTIDVGDVDVNLRASVG